MNREEAAAVLDAMIFGVYPDDDITINKIGIEAVRFAITALRREQEEREMTQEQRDDVYYEAIMIVNELHRTIDYSVYSRLIDLIDMLGLPAETCTVEQAKPARLDENGLVPCGCGGKAVIKKGDAAYGGYFAMCCGCECTVGFDRKDDRVFGEFADKEQAKTAWDTAMGWMVDDDSVAAASRRDGKKERRNAVE